MDTLGIHFIHERGKGTRPDATGHHPRLGPGLSSRCTRSSHCWPIPPHHGGNAEDSFDVVAPSLPGFGFSDHAMEPGMEVSKTAAMWVDLMNGLGYPRFASQGEGTLGPESRHVWGTDTPTA